MLSKTVLSAATGLLTLASQATAAWGPASSPHKKAVPDARLLKRQYYPANATDVKTITTPTNVTIRYKEPGKDGVCETTPGVNSYSGYVDLAPNVHVFFYFFESRNNPASDPRTCTDGHSPSFLRQS